MWNIEKEPRTLRTVSDFAAVPPGQLPDCLRAFKHWIQVRAAPADSPEAPVEFVWVPPAPAAAPASEELTPLTDVGKLGLRPGALQQFRRLNIFVLEDFSAVSRAEMGRLVNVGHTTVARIRDMLRSVGLDFRADEEAPTRTRPRPAARPKEPASCGDDASLVGLRLKPQTLGKLTLHGLRTVGELRELTPAQLAALLSMRRRQEVFRLLRAQGLNLRAQPTELELWRHGLVPVCDLARPSDEASVLSLQPWLGAGPTRAALDAGIATVGQLHGLAAAGAMPHGVRGLGPSTWSRIRKFLLDKPAARSASVP